VLAELGAHGGRAAALQADLMSPVACRQLVDEARQRLGGLDVLVNNAALFLPGDLAATTLEVWERQMALNLRAPWLLAQAFVAGLAPGAEGKIVNVGDARARRPGRGHLAYRVTKAALAHLTELLALELAPRVTVNAVAPGALLPHSGEEETAFRQRVEPGVPLRRIGGPEPVAHAVLFLLREDFATGVILPVDGGEFL
jgi:NAD(P)-dependent dehydrogenase (short-subunit alcohol dehydrogenase family)